MVAPYVGFVARLVTSDHSRARCAGSRGRTVPTALALLARSTSARCSCQQRIVVGGRVAVTKLSVSINDETVETVEQARDDERISVSSWLSAAASHVSGTVSSGRRSPRRQQCWSRSMTPRLSVAGGSQSHAISMVETVKQPGAPVRRCTCTPRTPSTRGPTPSAAPERGRTAEGARPVVTSASEVPTGGRSMRELAYHRLLLPVAERFASKVATIDGTFTATFGEHVERTMRLATRCVESSACRRATASP